MTGAAILDDRHLLGVLRGEPERRSPQPTAPPPTTPPAGRRRKAGAAQRIDGPTPRAAVEPSIGGPAASSPPVQVTTVSKPPARAARPDAAVPSRSSGRARARMRCSDPSSSAGSWRRRAWRAAPSGHQHAPGRSSRSNTVTRWAAGAPRAGAGDAARAAPKTATRRGRATIGSSGAKTSSNPVRGFTAHCGWPPSTNSLTQPS